MKLIKHSGVLLITLVITLLTITCCSTNQNKVDKKVKNSKKTSKKKLFDIQTQINMPSILGEDILFNLKELGNMKADSVKILIEGKNILANTSNSIDYSITTHDLSVGQKNLTLKIHYSDSLQESHSLKTLILAKNPPKELSYKVIRKFKHDSYAYTQGLIYDKGVLYESTGQENRSSLRSINPLNGEIQKKRDLEPQYFGEGIALIGDDIYMLTYKARKGFVFDIKTFELKRQFEIQTQEGWGLTTHNSKLILSDGSAFLFYYDPEYFTLDKQMEICDNQGLISNLNELEFTPYGLLANVYTKNYIVLINTETGEVIGKLDLNPLFPEGIQKDIHHVLNGIAYNNDKNTFYITGKQWPVTYEMEIMFD